MSALTVDVTDARGRPLAGGRPLARWLAHAAPTRARGAVTIAVVSDGAMRRLNRTYRGKDAATDVLSFGFEDGFVGDGLVVNPSPNNPSPNARSVEKPVENASLGDIVIARGVARRQARSAGHSEAVERRILALHGLLHLLGYDHETDDGVMNRIEERLRRRAGLPVGLITRARRQPR